MKKILNQLINFYKKFNLLKVINGEATIPEINDEISYLLESIKG